MDAKEQIEKQKTKSEPKRKGRRAYLDDYVKDASGSYVYTGTTYRWKNSRKASLGRLWIFALAAFAAQIAAGSISDTGMNGCAWVLLPYAAALITSVSLVWGNYMLTDGGEKIPEYVFQKSAEALPVRALLTAVFSGISLVGELVSMIRQSQFTGSISGALLFSSAEAVSLIFALLLRKKVLRLEWESTGTNQAETEEAEELFGTAPKA
ncbi:MAG: hypothetical protein LUG99_17035 [Lachnospiraceae bacterium]|nr:hypothetical protein [Lachnospiraceae bacterium]